MPQKTPTFQQFWDAYALKRDRMAAERAWRRLTAKDQRAAVAGISAYRDDCLRRGIAMMYGQGYLTHRRWEDEPSDDTAAASVPSGAVPQHPYPAPPRPGCPAVPPPGADSGTKRELGPAARTDLQSGRTEYKHLQCDNQRTVSPYIPNSRITNPSEQLPTEMEALGSLADADEW